MISHKFLKSKGLLVNALACNIQGAIVAFNLNYPSHNCHQSYLTLADIVMTGKNMPSVLKSLKKPQTLTPLTVNMICGTVKSSAQPITSPF